MFEAFNTSVEGAVSVSLNTVVHFKFRDECTY